MVKQGSKRRPARESGGRRSTLRHIRLRFWYCHNVEADPTWDKVSGWLYDDDVPPATV